MDTSPDGMEASREIAPSLHGPLVRALCRRALDEDLAGGDVTTDLTIPADATARGAVVSREDGRVAGVPVGRTVFELLDSSLEISVEKEEGAELSAGEVILRIRGSARSILRGERTALNFLQRMSGIATLASRFVAAVEGTGARIVDTRKTTPGLRVLEKYAVRCGGARNHRFGLSDGFLFKDNHRSVLRSRGESLKEALVRARERLPHTVPLEVEIDDPAQLSEALEAEVDAVLLDNFTPDQLRAAVVEARGRTLLEASGGISLDTVREVAETGVDLVSVGALTHSAPVVDLSLDFEVA